MNAKEEMEKERRLAQAAISFNAETPFKLRELAKQRRKERDGKIWDDRANFQKVEAVTRLLGSLPDHLTDQVFKFSIKNGYNPARLIPIIEELSKEREQQAKIEKIKQSENERQTIERNKFPNRFMRNCSYLRIKKYENDLSDAERQASSSDLIEAQKRLLSGEGNLTETQRSYALSWLNTKIQARSNTRKEPKSAIEKARSIFNLSRGH